VQKWRDPGTGPWGSGPRNDEHRAPFARDPVLSARRDGLGTARAPARLTPRAGRTRVASSGRSVDHAGKGSVKVVCNPPATWVAEAATVILIEPQTPLINVIGPFAWCGNPGGRLSPRQRSVVAALALGEGSEVESEVLVDRVWGQDPPPTARKALQVHIVAVRNVLGTERVLTTNRGYRLAAERHEVDAWHFEQLVRAALRSPGVHGEGLAEALTLWRGMPYEDLDVHVVAGTRVRLEELLAVAVDLRAELLLDRGAGAEAVRVLEPATLDDPLRERRWALLMVALYRAGRRVESLRAYQRARDALAVAAGLEPGRLLRVVERLVLDDDPRLWVRDLLDDPETLANLGTVDAAIIEPALR